MIHRQISLADNGKTVHGYWCQRCGKSERFTTTGDRDSAVSNHQREHSRQDFGEGVKAPTT